VSSVFVSQMSLLEKFKADSKMLREYFCVLCIGLPVVSFVLMFGVVLCKI
jgi:hypothetical protein